MGARPPGGRQGEGSRRASDGGEGFRRASGEGSRRASDGGEGFRRASGEGSRSAQQGLLEGLLRVLNLKYREFQISSQNQNCIHHSTTIQKSGTKELRCYGGMYSKVACANVMTCLQT